MSDRSHSICVGQQRAMLPFGGALPYYPGGGPLATAELAAKEELSPFRSRRTVMFAWEMGGGLGHLMQDLPLAQDLARAGHEVIVVLRDLSRAAGLYSLAGVHFLQAPISPLESHFPACHIYSHLLLNNGFANVVRLFVRACAWRNLFERFAPDLVIFDHAPTALLASRGLKMRRALIGSGFCAPPDAPVGTVWGVFRPECIAEADAARLHAAQDKLLANCNKVLAQWKQPPLDRIAQLYADIDEHLLTTLPELDHFPNRQNAGYFGQVISPSNGDQPHWPEASGRKIFAYLKPFKGIDLLLQELSRRANPTLLYLDGNPKDVDKHLSPTLLRVPRPLSMQQVAKECDLAILNAGHGATCELLLAGKPLLLFPLHLEQRLVALAVARLGAGLAPSPTNLPSIRLALDELLAGCHHAAAQALSARYSAFDSSNQRSTILRRATYLLAHDSPLSATAA